MKTKLTGLVSLIVIILLSLVAASHPVLESLPLRLSLPETAGHHNWVTIPPEALALIGPAAPPQPEEVIPFVKELYFHGVPYDAARQFGPEAVPLLLDLLADPANELYATNIVVTLGFIGHPTARPGLLDYLTQTSGEVSLAQFRGLRSVPYALAHLAHQGDAESLVFLLAASDPAYWANNPLPWSYQSQSQAAELYQQTLLALGVSGLPQAQARLTELAAQGNLSTQAGDDTLQQALALHQRVRQEGMAPVVSPDPNLPAPPELQDSLEAQAPDSNSVGHLQTFVVGRHTAMGSVPSNAQVDALLLRASEIMQTADSSADIACCVALQRNGPVGTFNTTDGFINTRTELNALFNLNSYQVKVVPALDYCGGYNPGIIGCAYISSSKNMILEYLGDVTLDGILWAHEFGHNQGLYHPDPPVSTRIMNGSLSYFAKQMTQTECNAWHNTFQNPGTPGACPIGFSISKSLSPGPEATANAIIEYTITVRNNSFQTVTGITVSDSLPPQLSYVAGSAVASPAIVNLTNFPASAGPFTLNSQQSVQITYRVRVAATVSKGDRLVNTATVTATSPTLSASASYFTIVNPEKIFLPLLLKNN